MRELSIFVKFLSDESSSWFYCAKLRGVFFSFVEMWNGKQPRFRISPWSSSSIYLSRIRHFFPARRQQKLSGFLRVQPFSPCSLDLPLLFPLWPCNVWPILVTVRFRDFASEFSLSEGKKLDFSFLTRSVINHNARLLNYFASSTSDLILFYRGH